MCQLSRPSLSQIQINRADAASQEAMDTQREVSLTSEVICYE